MCTDNILFQIPEYCKSMEETDIADQAFPLIFAFDEVVALGYRESVNLAQIRTFTEMDSHEEKIFQAVRQVWSYWHGHMINHVNVVAMHMVHTGPRKPSRTHKTYFRGYPKTF